MNRDALEGLPDVLSVRDLQALLQIGRSQAYQLIHDNRVKHIRIGKTIRIPKVYVLEFFAESERLCYNQDGCSKTDGPC